MSITPPQYERLLELLNYRRSIRNFKPDPIPEDFITKILDAAHLSMSGGNSQPWEFVVITDPEIKKGVYAAYVEELEAQWALEQQRTARYRHPAFNVPEEEKDKAFAMNANWQEAPAYLAVLEDPRKQFGSVMYAFAEITAQSIRSLTMGHVSMVIHLAAASLGLGSQRVDVRMQTRYRQILGYPEPLQMDSIVPIGYRAYEPGPPHRLPLEGMLHRDNYNKSKYLNNKEFLDYLDRIRALGRPGYRAAIGEDKG